MEAMGNYVSLFGGIGGAVTTLVLVRVGQFFTRPKLVLSFDENGKAYMASSTHRENDQKVTRRYIRVSLRTSGCLGSSAATNCRIYITAIQCDGTDYLHDARTISWPPNKDWDPRTIPRGITMFANVVTMRVGVLHWNFQLPDQYGLHSVRSHPGILRLRITATADNAKPCSIEIEASIKADHSGFQARLVK
jgi:hypothetical protein